ncbi:MAG: 6-phospho-beta-glucosidase, partial [Gaiellales bacterium]|nr:6-phospho-beta-glucosidase [Gaiellales bacterium]
MKICVVGGGSTYTPELVDGLLRRRDRLPVGELMLLDPDEERLEIVGRFARRMCEASGSDLQVR